MSDPTTPLAHLEVEAPAPDRNLALELVGVAAAERSVGRDDKNGAR